MFSLISLYNFKGVFTLFTVYFWRCFHSFHCILLKMFSLISLYTFEGDFTVYFWRCFHSFHCILLKVFSLCSVLPGHLIAGGAAMGHPVQVLHAGGLWLTDGWPRSQGCHREQAADAIRERSHGLWTPLCEHLSVDTFSVWTFLFCWHTFDLGCIHH